MDSIISTFHIDWKIIIAQAVNFTIVFIVLYIYALKPLSKLMAERSEKIKGGLENAKANAALLEKSRQEHEEILRRAKIEANNIFQEGKKEAEVKKVSMLEDAKTEVKSMIEGGKAALQAEKAKMMEEAKHEIATLAVQAAEKILGSTHGSYDQKLVNDLNDIK